MAGQRESSRTREFCHQRWCGTQPPSSLLQGAPAARARGAPFMNLRYCGCHGKDPATLVGKATYPQTTDWATACRYVRRMNSSWPNSLPMLIASRGSSAKRISRVIAQRLRTDLAARGVLCDSVLRCNVSLSDDCNSITICLPREMIVQGSHVCEPWGELWQQQGGPVILSSDSPKPGCFSFDLIRLASWWSKRRSSQPFLSGMDDRDALDLLHKKSRGKNLDEMGRLRRLLLSASIDSTNRPLRFETCAFVGSGHDLRCGPPRGAEIDAHDAVFRANAFQATVAKHEGRGSGDGTLQQRRVGERRLRQRTLSRRARAGGSETHSVSAQLAGARTDFRVNCLYESLPVSSVASNLTRRAETCIISQAWWAYAPGKELFNNRRRPCCEQKLRSDYTLTNLQRLSSHGAVFRWFRGGLASGIKAIDDMLDGSGGNAVQAAITMCEHVDVYGAGLLSAGPASDKIYAHAYDNSVGECLQTGPLRYRFSKYEGYGQYRSWLAARIESEMVLHVLHAVGAIHWEQ
mmetsp:Transcript_38488/g.87453  ORF Transcript_38488/g.87453 Transcript_38488/m.87453 type:complete len:520 (-) Transcript_38488:135-1694(-)